MGAGNTTLTSLQRAEVARVMKNQYEQCQKSSMSVEEQRVILMKKYNESVKQVVFNPLNVVTSNAKRLNKTLSKDEHSLKSKSKSKTRRRSFDAPRKSPSKSSASINKSKEDSKMSQSESVPFLDSSAVAESEPVQADSWESVNGQPSCLICGMVFATPAKLKNHINFSSLHASTVKKMEAEANQSTEEKEVSEKKHETPQEPSARCRAIYTGSKLFWKTQDNFDIHMYLHIDTKCIEVIPYDSSTTTELPRIYFNENSLINLIGRKSIDDRVSGIQKKAAGQRFKEALPPTPVLFEEEKRIVLTSHIISHLQMRREPESKTDIYVKALQYGQSSEDLDGIDVVYASKPEGITPVHVARRRHTSEQEIKDTMEDISNMQLDIKSMTKQAERMANLVTSSVASFSGAAERRRKMEKLSVPARRWVWAINFVLLQNRVAVTHRILATYNGKY